MSENREHVGDATLHVGVYVHRQEDGDGWVAEIDGMGVGYIGATKGEAILRLLQGDRTVPVSVTLTPKALDAVRAAKEARRA